MTRVPVEIIYDGECPFCTVYVRMLRLREGFDVTLMNAREAQVAVAELQAQGFSISDGMVVRTAGQVFWGADAMHFLATASTASGVWNRVVAAVFRHPKLARALYPSLRAGRNMTLRLLGRRQAI